MELLPDELVAGTWSQATCPSLWPWTRLILVNQSMRGLCLRHRADELWRAPHKDSDAMASREAGELY